MKTKGNTGQRKQCRTALTHSYSSYSPHYKQTLVRHFNWILFADLKATVSLTSLWWEDGEGVYTTSPFISITSQDGGPPLREEGKLKKKRRGEEDYWDMAYIRFSGPGRGEGGERRDSRKKKEDASARLTCGDWTCSALLTPSIAQIIRSEKSSGWEEGRSVRWWDWWIDVSLGESVHCSIRCRQMSRGREWRDDDRPE